jgi:hypothetical protein
MSGLDRLRAHVNEAFIVVNRAVQPLLALGFGGAFIYLTIIGTVPAEAFVSLATAVVLYWFNSEDKERTQQRTEAQQTELVELAKRLPPPPVS